jgi:hypothetical protein
MDGSESQWMAVVKHEGNECMNGMNGEGAKGGWGWVLIQNKITQKYLHKNFTGSLTRLHKNYTGSLTGEFNGAKQKSL